MRLLFTLAAACTLTAAVPLNVGAPGDVGPIGTICNHPALSPSAQSFFPVCLPFSNTRVRVILWPIVLVCTLLRSLLAETHAVRVAALALHSKQASRSQSIAT